MTLVTLGIKNGRFKSSCSLENVVIQDKTTLHPSTRIEIVKKKTKTKTKHLKTKNVIQLKGTD